MTLQTSIQDACVFLTIRSNNKHLFISSKGYRRFTDLFTNNKSWFERRIDFFICSSQNELALNRNAKDPLDQFNCTYKAIIRYLGKNPFLHYNVSLPSGVKFRAVENLISQIFAATKNEQ